MMKTYQEVRRRSKYYDGTELTSRHLQDVIPLVLKKLKGLREVKGDQILAAWPTIIGERFSPMTRAESFLEGVLTVRVNNSTLFSLLQQHEKKRLLKALEAQFPAVAIKTIVFRMG